MSEKRITAEMLLEQLRFVPDLEIPSCCERHILDVLKTAIVNANADGRGVRADIAESAHPIASAPNPLILPAAQPFAPDQGTLRESRAAGSLAESKADLGDADIQIAITDLLKQASPSRRLTIIDMVRMYFDETSAIAQSKECMSKNSEPIIIKDLSLADLCALEGYLQKEACSSPYPSPETDRQYEKRAAKQERLRGVLEQVRRELNLRTKEIQA